MDEIRDESLSEEELDVASLDPDERAAWWERWFRHAQATNEQDRWVISHGVFTEVPDVARDP